MPSPGQPWPLNLKVAVSFFYALAISSGIFRSTYRWHNSRFGWDDAWALLALLTNITSLTCAWLERSATMHLSHSAIALNWVETVALTSALWQARLSMMTAIIRITNPCALARRVSYAIAISFGLMWIGVLTQKMYNDSTRLSAISHAVAISQLITDVISDAFLVAMPIFFLQGMRISLGQRVLLVSSFASSICITVVSIAHSIIIFLPVSDTSLFVAHVKAALAVIICNLLVVLTFIYRFYRKADVDPDGALDDEELVQFTTIIFGQSSLTSCPCPTSLPDPRIRCTASS